MDELDQILNNLPKPKMRLRADFKLSAQLRYYRFKQRFNKGLALFAFKSVVFQRAMVAALILVFVFGATSIYAYNSDAVLPGSRLYPLKIAVENAQEQLTVSPQAKAQLYQQLSERRFQEAIILSHTNAGSPTVSRNIQANIEEAVNNLGLAVVSARNINNSQVSQEVLDSVKTKQDQAMNYLDSLDQTAVTGQDPQIQQKVEYARILITDNAHFINLPVPSPHQEVQGVRIDAERGQTGSDTYSPAESRPAYTQTPAGDRSYTPVYVAPTEPQTAAQPAESRYYGNLAERHQTENVSTEHISASSINVAPITVNQTVPTQTSGSDENEGGRTVYYQPATQSGASAPSHEATTQPSAQTGGESHSETSTEASQSTEGRSTQPATSESRDSQTATTESSDRHQTTTETNTSRTGTTESTRSGSTDHHSGSTSRTRESSEEHH